MESEEAVLSASEGVPLYLREFVRSARDSTTVVPPTLERLILARLDRLPPVVKDAASALSVAGSTVDLEVARALVPDEDLNPALLELGDQGLMDVGGTSCSFSHGLVQEVAYSTLLRPRRRQLHRRTAEWLEASSKEHPDATLAYHWERAGEFAHAIPYHVAAADEAEAVSGSIEALGHVDAPSGWSSSSMPTPTSVGWSFAGRRFIGASATWTPAGTTRSGRWRRRASAAIGHWSWRRSRSSARSSPGRWITGPPPRCSMRRSTWPSCSGIRPGW